MSEEVYSEKEGDFTLRIVVDEDPLNPRKEYDNFGHMICFHNRYNLGDKTSFRSSEFLSWEGLKGYLVDEEKAKAILPLYLYDHSGVTMSTTPFSCPWDSGQVGFIYATRDDIRKEFKTCGPKTIKKALEVLETEVKVYDAYLTGNVYGFEISDSSGYVVESCYGFIELGSSIEHLCVYSEGRNVLKRLVKEANEKVLSISR